MSNDPEPVSSDESDNDENVATGVSNAPVSKESQRSNNARGVSFGDVIADRDETTSTGNGSGTSGVAVATASTSGGKARRTSQDKVSRVLSECFSGECSILNVPRDRVAFFG